MKPRNFALLRALGAFLVTAGTLATPALAQDYPARPIRFVVPFPAGSGTDTISRLMLDEITRSTKASFVFEYKPGAIGTIGTDFAAKSAPDGYTMMVSSSATHSSGPSLVKNVPYDPVKDFSHVARICGFDIAMVVNSQRGFKSVLDFVADAKKSPGKYNFGYGSGTAQVIAMSFARSAGVQVQGIAYKGQPPALTDLMGGQIQFVMADLAVAMTHIKSGRLEAIGLAAPRRSSLLPGVPTFTELGLREVELAGWVGVSGPAGLPREVVSWWSTQMNRALARREFLDRLAAISVEGEPNTVEEFNAHVRTQLQTWGQRIREAGIKPE
ncbi:MAG: Bug family tripartite tricarboxylate transporter substrate binding protein [Burkholderiales bacterium]